MKKSLRGAENLLQVEQNKKDARNEKSQLRRTTGVTIGFSTNITFHNTLYLYYSTK